MSELWVVALGDAFDGLSLFGPFDDCEEACEWAERNADGDWHSLLISPTDVGSV